MADTGDVRYLVDDHEPVLVLQAGLRAAVSVGRRSSTRCLPPARDVDDVESIFEARAAARDVLDWTFLERWTEAWGISDRLEPYRRRFKGS